MSAVTDQADAASAETRRLLARTGIGGTTPGPDSNPWAEQFVNQMIDRGGTSTCPHAKRRVVQPLFATAWERLWRCQRCHDTHAHTTVDQMKRGMYRDLGLIEEHTCDRCRRYARQLTMLVVRNGFMVMTAGVCTRCADDAKQGGAKAIAS